VVTRAGLAVNVQGHVHLVRFLHGTIERREEFAAAHFDEEGLQPGIRRRVAAADGLLHPRKQDLVVACAADAPRGVEVGHPLGRGVVGEIGQEAITLLVDPIVPGQVGGGEAAVLPSGQHGVDPFDAGAGHAGAVVGQARAIDPLVEPHGGQVGLVCEERALEVVDEALGVHALEGVFLEVAGEPFVEAFAADGVFHEPQEEVALVVGDGGHAVVGVTALQVELQMGVVRIEVTDGVNFIDQPLVAQGGEHFTHVPAVDGLHDPLLEVDREALIEPEVIPCGVGHEVAAPGVGEFVRHEGHEGAVSGDDGRGGKRQARVFHSAKGEGRRKDEQVIALPGIRAVKVFCGDQEVLHFGEFIGGLVNQVGRGVHCAALADGPVLHFADGQREEVGGDGLGHAEGIHAIVAGFRGILCTHHRHQSLRDAHLGVIGEPDAGRVLHRNPGPGQDGLALGEQEWGAVSLGFDPQQGIGVRTRRVLDGDPFGTRLE